MKNLLLLSFLLPFISTLAQNYIQDTFPAQNQLNISRDTQIIITFNETMSDSTLNDSSIVVYGTLSGRHYGNISYDDSIYQVIYSPLKMFAVGEKVFVSLTNKIKNESGIPLSPTYSFEFNVRSDGGSNSISCAKYQDIPDLYNIEDMKVLDVDDDGDYDLVFCDYYGSQSGRRINVFKNDGNANFQESDYVWLPGVPSHLSTGDFNNDGIQDIAVVAGNQILFLKNNGNGQFDSWRSIDIENSGFIVSGDFNNDGLIDVLGLEIDYEVYPVRRKVSFIKNLGNGNFEKINSFEFSQDYNPIFYAEAGDLNNDGFMDIVISRVDSNQVFLLLNNGEGTFSLGTIKYLDDWSISLVLGDFDIDSDIDLALSTDSGLDIYQNYGNTVFVYFYSYYLHSVPWKTVCTDFNNDGKLDLAITYGVGHRIGIYWGNGSLYYDYPFQVYLNPSSNPKLMEYADFDGDGDIDLVVLNDDWMDRKLYFFRNGAAAVNIEESIERLPSNFYLFQNYPNPFNPSTRIKYRIAESAKVTLSVYDILGNRISTLVNEIKPAGSYEVAFDGSDLPSGIYFYRIETISIVTHMVGFSDTKKLLLMK